MNQHDPKLLIQGFQNEILEAVATGVPFRQVATLLCRRAEELAPQAICSILTIDDRGLLHPVAAPSLPDAYSDALDGAKIGPTLGSCGSAAYLGEPVEVTDIATDERWVAFRHLALPLGLLACWSSPIKARDGRVVATFAFYYRSCRGPSTLERLIVQAGVHLCAIALEHDEVRHRNHVLANFDQLTSLPNRRRFDQAIAAQIASPGKPFGLLLIDIDHLKTTNDTMGHLVGDALIREVAQRLQRGPRGVCSYRIGGDEFATIVEDCPDRATLRDVAAALLQVVGVPFHCDGNMVRPRVTMGGVVHGLDGEDVAVLRQNADFALYHAKETARGGYVAFEEGLRTSLMCRMRKIRQVDEALRQERIMAHYQPLVHLETMTIVGLEALARIRSLDGGIVSVGAFQSALSDPDIAGRLTNRMLADVARDIRGWLDAGVPFQHVGLNLSAADFGCDRIEARVCEAFAAAGAPLNHLVLEVTEQVLLEARLNKAVNALVRLREKGVIVALDDFGTGYSSLTHLVCFPVDVIKIDRSFVDRILTHRPSEAIVEALIGVAEKLGIRIIAEGVEDAAQQARLIELGCAFGQGYHFARPADVHTTTHLLTMFARKPPAERITSTRVGRLGEGQTQALARHVA